MGKLNSFQIIYDQPLGVIQSGGQLSGKVIIDVKEEVKLRGIRITVYGYADVFWSSSSGNNSNNYTKSEGYLKRCITLWGKGPDDKGKENPVLNPGRYEFTFSTVIPVTAPSSFEDETGSVKYFCKVVADRPWRFNYTTEQPFTVIRHYDLNAQPRAGNCARVEKKKTICCFCCISGPITCSTSIPRIGYVPGEYIPFSAEVINNSRRSVSSTKVALKQYLTYYSSILNKTKSKRIAGFVSGPIQAGSSYTWSNFPIPIPSIPASKLTGCSIIDISYKLKFKVTPSGIATSFTVHLPIIIGTIPLRNFISSYPAAPEESHPAAPEESHPAAPEESHPAAPEESHPAAPEKPHVYHDIPPPNYLDSRFEASDTWDDSENQSLI